MPVAIEKLKFKRVPPFLKSFATAIEKAVNARTPIEGLGIELTQDPNGVKVETDDAVAQDKAKRGGAPSVGGSTADLAGMLNGAPAIYHLRQVAAPTTLPVPP